MFFERFSNSMDPSHMGVDKQKDYIAKFSVAEDAF